ncbi:MAG: PQQ-binding-like beta-propeller repeat protein [Sedimentisphaerales bacterium]
MKKFSLLLLLIFAVFQSSTCDAAISEKLLNEAGLQTIWQSSIALNPPDKKTSKEKVQKITILDNYLYILTSNNYLFCLDRNTGRLSFGTIAAAGKLPVFEPAECNGLTYFIAANNLIIADVEKGAELHRDKLPFIASAAAAVNSSYRYIPAADKRLHVIDSNSKLEIFTAEADKVSPITSVLADDNSVFFATQGGNVLCMTPSQPKKLWQFDAVDAIMAPLVKVNNWLYVSSKDTNLYKLDAKSGKKIWEFHTGSALNTPSRATETIVYQYALNKGLYAIDANSGKQLWLEPDGVELLAQNGNIAYTFDKDKTCSVMDNKESKKIYTINFADVTNYAANVLDDRIYIMEDKNIYCIGPK